MTLQVCALSKSRHMIGEPYEVHTTLEEFLQGWRDAQDDFILPDDLEAAVRVTGQWDGWTVVRVVCHPDAREPVSYYGVKVICDVNITNSEKREENGRDCADAAGSESKWITFQFSDEEPSVVDVRDRLAITVQHLP